MLIGFLLYYNLVFHQEFYIFDYANDKRKNKIHFQTLYIKYVDFFSRIYTIFYSSENHLS